MTRRAVFLDRDGTIIRDTDFVATPEEVELLPGAAGAIRRLNEAGIPAVVVTNQSGIARGYFGQAEYERVRDRLDELLAAAGARLDATYLCPHHPDLTGPCECRKPGTLLFRTAAKDLGLQLEGSWFIGDKLRDIEPAKTLGGRGILLRTSSGHSGHSEESADPATSRSLAALGMTSAGSLDEAVRQIIESTR